MWPCFVGHRYGDLYIPRFVEPYLCPPDQIAWSRAWRLPCVESGLPKAQFAVRATLVTRPHVGEVPPDDLPDQEFFPGKQMVLLAYRARVEC
jgi:hypothetical protein